MTTLVSNHFTPHSKKKRSLSNSIEIFGAARTALFQYIENWYNRKRIHGSNGYLTPDEYE